MPEQLSCIIKEEIKKEDKVYFLIEETINGIEHLIPKEQIVVFENFNLSNKYDFIKNFNQNHNRTYFSITHPEFKINEEITLKIKDLIEIKGEKYFELESDYLRPLTVKAYDWQYNFSAIKCKIQGYRKGRPRLVNIELNNKWNIDEIKLFTIIGYEKITTKSGVDIDCVEIEDESSEYIIKVRVLPWQKKEIWNFKEIYCKVKDIFPNGSPKLITFDSRHPHYSIGSSYKFKIESFKDKLSYKGESYKVIVLEGEESLKYEVLAIPNQENRLRVGNVIECLVQDINTRVRLKQINSVDPFFYDFDTIVKDSKTKEKYFLPYLEQAENSNIKLRSQYEQKSGFWVFTYCNNVIAKLKYESSIRHDLQSVIELIDIHNIFENWILKSGILRAIQDDRERKRTKHRTEQIISNNNLEKETIDFILNFKQDEFYLNQEKEIDYNKIYYFIKNSIFGITWLGGRQGVS